MIQNVARAIANYALNALPTFPPRAQVLTRLFEDTLMFLGANALLALRGHPGLFIAGYFTGIVLDKAVQENFEKIKRVIPFTLLIPACLGQEALRTYIHTATFIIACKIGSVMSNRYFKNEITDSDRPKSRLFQNIFMLIGSGLLWLLKVPPVLLLAGFLCGTLFKKEVDHQFEKIKRIAFGDPFIMFGQFWFGVATLPFIVQAAAFILPAKFGSILTLRYLPRPDGSA